MTLWTNQRMLDLLGEGTALHEPSSMPISPELEARAIVGFKELDGCIVPKSFTQESIWSEDRPCVINKDDETGFECSLHEVPVDSYLDSGLELRDLARSGVDFAWLLRRELLNSDIQGHLKIIVSVMPANSDLKVGPICTVRFHRIRSGQVWLDDNLENYKEEAIVALDFWNPDPSRQKHEEWVRSRKKPTPELAARALKLLARSGGNTVEPGDELPEGYRRK